MAAPDHRGTRRAQSRPSRSSGSPFAVNQIVHKTNNRLEDDIALCAKWQVPDAHHLARAREDVYQAAHSWGGIVLHDVINDRFARKAIEKGADGLIPVAAAPAAMPEPSPPSRWCRKSASGSTASSRCRARSRTALDPGGAGRGRRLAYIGSAWIATHEARAADTYKQAIVDSSAADIVYSNLFTGVHGNYLRSSIVAAGLDPDNLPESDPSKMNFGSGGNTDAKAWKDIWGSGQGIGAITAVESVAERVARFTSEYRCRRRPCEQERALSRVGETHSGHRRLGLHPQGFGHAVEVAESRAGSRTACALASCPD
jgi:nitronate monooxygenase